MTILTLLLILLALVFFVLAGWGVTARHHNLGWYGLAIWLFVEHVLPKLS